MDETLQQFDLLGQCCVACNHAFDLADRMENRGVVPVAEPASDFRQRPPCHDLCDVHRDLARTDKGPGTARRQQVRFGNAEVLADNVLNVFNLDGPPYSGGR